MSTLVYPDIRTGLITVVPEWRTLVSEYTGGQEQRDQRWLTPRYRFEVSYELLLESEWATLKNFHDRHAGGKESFYFRDFTAPNPVTGQEIGLGNGARTIFKLHHDQLAAAAIYKDAVLQAQPGDVSVNLATGRVTFVSAPAANARITADVTDGLYRVRFVDEALSVQRRRGIGWTVRVTLQQTKGVDG